nr:immunoglobulin light chain junction region [Macaca mulatta]
DYYCQSYDSNLRVF